MLLLLPGLTIEDAIELGCTNSDEAEICAMTMQPITQCSTVAFLDDMMELCDNDTVRRRCAGIMRRHSPRWPACMGVARLRECGHSFSALPLIYLFMCGKARCPMCRCGSDREVRLTARGGPSLPHAMWLFLCLLCGDAKVRDRAAIAHEQDLQMQAFLSAEGLQVLELRDILELVVFRAIFSVYRADEGAASTRGSRPNPVAVMVIDMHLREPLATLREGAPVVFTSSSCRGISKTMRLGAVFGVRVIADMLEDSITLFDSDTTVYPCKMPDGPKHVTLNLTPENPPESSLCIRYEACPYDHIYVTRCVEFSASEQFLRDMLAQL